MLGLWEEQLGKGLAEMKLAASPQQQRVLLDYLALLEKWNKAFNLTAVRDPLKMVSRQLLDSLSIQHLLEGDHILDVGSGAGLPGIPLSILNPGRSFTLLDTNSKKTRFLRQAKLELQLDNVDVEQTRVEQFQPRRLFDVITSRAFASLPDMLQLTRHLLAPGGCWLAMKGVAPGDELESLSGKYFHEIQALHVANESGQRHGILIRPKM
ncbi:MAG TPA: 16S rRNA (guanine(527)-N(7))-methyltransferase RsmG [Chromatiaceae bacterium]|nr:16S rRNA (guanine(527)-N(7))-methyltransferase RsmG [Chromatiaceae bacterium]